MVNAITSQEQEIFQDIAETGIFHSLKALEKLSGRDWCAFPRKFEFLSYEQARALMPEKETARFGADMMLGGDTPMAMLCLFPQESALNLMHFMTDKADSETSDLTSLQTLAVAEVSNILVTTFINVIANTLKMRLLPTAPRVLAGSRAMLLESAAARSATPPDCVLLSDLRFESDNLTMTGNFYILLDSPSLKKLTDELHASPVWSAKKWRIF